jgi:hypothetical protein
MRNPSYDQTASQIPCRAFFDIRVCPSTHAGGSRVCGAAATGSFTASAWTDVPRRFKFVDHRGSPHVPDPFAGDRSLDDAVCADSDHFPLSSSGAGHTEHSDQPDFDRLVHLSNLLSDGAYRGRDSSAGHCAARGRNGHGLGSDRPWLGTPLRKFMLQYTREKDLALFVEMSQQPRPKQPEDIPMSTIIPAYIISEIKTGFQIGAILFLPFLVIDMVTASVTTSIGMMQLPPVVISTPLKILLFVVADGWNLVIGSLMKSFH